MMAAAMTPNAMFWATTGLLLALHVGPGLEGGRLRHRLHPLAEALLVVEQVGDLELRVLELRAPEQGVERAHLDADPAVHAEAVVDVEAVEDADRALLAAGAAGRGLGLVTLDVDAPVRAAAGAQHADGAVLLLEGDHPARTRGRRLLLVRVLGRDRRPDHGAEGHAQALDEPRDL